MIKIEFYVENPAAASEIVLYALSEHKGCFLSSYTVDGKAAAVPRRVNTSTRIANDAPVKINTGDKSPFTKGSKRARSWNILRKYDGQIVPRSEIMQALSKQTGVTKRSTLQFMFSDMKNHGIISGVNNATSGE